MKLFLSPHNDDETLFGAWTILREQPLVAIVFDAWVQFERGTGATPSQRRWESIAAMQVLGVQEVELLGHPDAAPDAAAIEQSFHRFGQPEMVYAPAVEPDGHAHHNLVGHLAGKVFENVTYYLTYTRAGKSRGNEVQIEDGAWIGKKLKALACYESQHSLDPRLGCWPHFVNDLREYYA